MKPDIDDPRIKITNGKFVIESAVVVLEREDVVIIECDCKSKYPDVFAFSGDGNDISVIIAPRDDGSSLYLDESAESEFTDISWAASDSSWRYNIMANASKYTIQVCVWRYPEHDDDIDDVTKAEQ